MTDYQPLNGMEPTQIISDTLLTLVLKAQWSSQHQSVQQAAKTAAAVFIQAETENVSIWAALMQRNDIVAALAEDKVGTASKGTPRAKPSASQGAQDTPKASKRQSSASSALGARMANSC
jgi:hypothetical protein